MYNLCNVQARTDVREVIEASGTMGGLIEALPKAPRTSGQYGTEGFTGWCSIGPPLYREAAPPTVDGFFFRLGDGH